jgi:hypothetical protein
MKSRALDWLRRYLPAECASLVGAVLVARLALFFTDNFAIAAVAAAWGETIVYYTVMSAREVLAVRSVARAVGNLVFEFGIAEALDSLLLRPLCMYLATQFLGDLTLGTIVGKFAADLAFYVPAISAYELRRRVFLGPS